MKVEIETKYNPGDIVYIVTPIDHEIKDGKIARIWTERYIYPNNKTDVSYGVQIKGEKHLWFETENSVFTNIEDARHFAKKANI